MSFLKALNRHINAIQAKNIDELQATLPAEGHIHCILPDGTVLDTLDDVVDFFDDWFADEEWSIENQVVFSEESKEIAYGIVHSAYKGIGDDGEPFDVSMMSTYIFRKSSEEWFLISSHNTEVEPDDEEDEQPVRR